MSEDPVCVVCGEPCSAHVWTTDGPFTHPKVARGEGRYELVSPGFILGGGVANNDEYVDPTYRFVPCEPKK